MRSFSPSTGALVLAFALAASAAQAQVYKWTDANGQVHYSDSAPSNAQQIKGPTPPSDTTAPAPNAAPPPAAAKPAPAPAAPPALTAQQKQQVQRDVAAVRAQQCKEATEQYEKSVRAQKMFKTNEKGEREYISTAEADQMRLQLQAAKISACGS